MTTKRKEVERRVKEVGKYIVENRCTVRECAEVIGVSKSTIHKDIRDLNRLMEVDRYLYDEVEEVMKTNLEERSMRGGIATKKKHGKI